jgi:IS30 family transposase
MDYPHNTTEHAKWKHLTFQDYVIIELRLKDGWSANRIARKELHCSPNTVRNIIRKGMVSLYHGKVRRFKAKAAWAAYNQNRANSRRHYDVLKKSRFLDYTLKHFKEDGWSMDACAGRALVDGEFTRDETVCTKTLYNYIDMGLLGVKNIDLPVKLRRSTKKHKSRENKRILGRSIEERPEHIETREEFGHWEADLVIGSKSGEDTPILTMLERKTRLLMVIRLADKSADSVAKAFADLRAEWGDNFDQVFKTITTDNGSEFARLAEIETLTQTKVYFAHPYTSCEKGSIENHNGLIRRFIPKGKRISDYSDEHLLNVELWANQLPRKILGYKTPDEAFEYEMDLLFAA